MTMKIMHANEHPLNDTLNADNLQIIANRICKHTPEGFEISLHFNDDCAYVSLWRIKQQNNQVVGHVELPDDADKSLLEQLNDALCVANGFSI